MANLGVHAPLSEKEELVATSIVSAAYTVHQALGPGLLESIYEMCFCHSFVDRASPAG